MLILHGRMFQFTILRCKLQSLNRGNESNKILKNVGHSVIW